MAIIPRAKAPESDPTVNFLTAIELPEFVHVNDETRTLSFRMNQSRLQVYMDCFRRFYWKFEENLDLDRPQIKLELGSGAHEGLAVMAAGGSNDEVMRHAIARFRRDLPSRLLPGDQEEIEKAEDTLRQMLPAYREHWTHQNFTPLGLEVGGCVQVGSFVIAKKGPDGLYVEETWTVELVFRLDKLVTFNNQLWIVDHKTAAKLDMRDIAKYAIDVQMTAYTYAATRILQMQGDPNARVQGVIIDVLVKTKVPQFHRDLFYRTDDDLVEFQYDFTLWAEKIIRDRLRKQEFELAGIPGRLAYPKNTKSCYHWGTCPFLNLCIKDTPINRAEFKPRAQDYVENPALLEKAKSDV